MHQVLISANQGILHQRTNEAIESLGSTDRLYVKQFEETNLMHMVDTSMQYGNGDLSKYEYAADCFEPVLSGLATKMLLVASLR